MWRAWIVLVLLVASRSSAAAPAHHALHWVRAEGAERCIDPKALALRVEALTGPVFVAPGQAELSIEGVVAPATRGFRVRLASTERDGVQSGERVLTTANADCRELDAAIAFVIALTIDPGLSLEGLSAELLAEFAQELPPEQVLLAELAAQPPPQPARDVLDITPGPNPSSTASTAAKGSRSRPASLPPARYALSLAVATLGRTLPDWSFGLRAAFGFDHPRLLPLVWSATAFPQTPPRAIQAGQEASFRAFDATLSVCPKLRWRDLRVHACLGPALSYLQAQGKDFESNRRAALWDPALDFGLLLNLELGRGFGLRADAALRVRLTDQRFAFTPAHGPTQSAYTPERLGLLFSVGPRYEF